MRKTSLTEPVSLWVSISWLRRGLYVVNPAASWPRFWTSSKMRGISRDTSSGSLHSGLGSAAGR